MHHGGAGDSTRESESEFHARKAGEEAAKSKFATAPAEPPKPKPFKAPEKRLVNKHYRLGDDAPEYEES
jgi:hypothetical protein